MSDLNNPEKIRKFVKETNKAYCEFWEGDCDTCPHIKCYYEEIDEPDDWFCRQIRFLSKKRVE